MSIHIGSAGWTIPKPHASSFPQSGSHLERYSARFNAVEINSSFYRPHRPETYERWAEATPDEFRFAAKVPREITHECCLRETTPAVERFLGEVNRLGDKLGPLLVQLPPSLAMDGPVAAEFFSMLRERFAGAVVFEPRHPTWFTSAADELLKRFTVSRVAADPAVVPAAVSPGGWKGLAYYRLHGTPRVYWSEYSADFLATLADQLTARAKLSDAWCIFANTAQGWATANALDLRERLSALTP
jgi:uncharacterized protein YecE (DUF72 family)